MFNSRNFLLLCFLLPPLCSAQNHNKEQRHQVRDIFSPIESFADSVFGITATQSTHQTVAATLTSQQTTTAEDNASSASPQVTSAVTTAAATPISSDQSNPTETVSEATTSSSSTATSATEPTTTTTSSSSTSPEPTISPTSLPNSSILTAPLTSTVAAPANPLQGQPLASSTPQSTGSSANSVPAAGIAVGAVFGVIVLATLGYLFYRLYPGLRQKISRRDLANGINEKSCQDSRFTIDEEQCYSTRSFSFGELGKSNCAQEVAELQDNQSYRTRSRAASEDTLFAAPTLPTSPLDRKDSPLPPLPPPTAPASWPIVTPIDTWSPPPPSIRRKPVGGYVPYSPDAEMGIGVAVPLSRTPVQLVEGSPAAPSMSNASETRSMHSGARQVGGMQELS